MDKEKFKECELRGATTVVGHVFGTDLSHIPEWIMIQAQERGTAVHKYIEDYFTQDEATLDLMYWDYRAGFEDWLKQFESIETLHTEYMFIDEELGFKGIIDWVGYLDGELTIIDWKTSTSMTGETKMSAIAQINLYGLIFPEANLRVVSVQKNKYTDIMVERDEELAQNILSLYEFRNKFKKPKRRVK